VEVILDTNAVSDFADANQRLLNCLQQSAADIHLPVIVLGEYRYGVKSSRLRVARERWLDELESRPWAPTSQSIHESWKG
jgi:predicted nucleic acid-binding protein